MAASDRGNESTVKLAPLSGNEVDAFLQQLEHPLRDDVVRVRQVILTAAPGISEELRGNAPSFRTASQNFCSFYLKSQDAVELVLQRSAKRPLLLSDKAKPMVKWLDESRALVTIRPQRLASSRAALAALIREWVADLETPPT